MKTPGRILLVLLFGAVTTIGVAWGVALFPPQTNCTYSMCPLREPSDHHLYVRVMQEPAANIEWFYIYPSYISNDDPTPLTPSIERGWKLDNETFSAADRALLFYFERPMVPSWLPASIDTMDGVIGYGGRVAGWPCYAMRTLGYAEVMNAPARWEWCWRVRQAVGPGPTPSSRVDPTDGTVPLQPIPLGFSVNTALFAAGWWIVIFVPRDLRGWVRRRRNLCERCAYSREALQAATPCPECGLARAL